MRDGMEQGTSLFPIPHVLYGAGVWMLHVNGTITWGRNLRRFLSVSLMEPVYSTIMMTSSNGNIVRVNGPLWVESTGHRWIPRNKDQWRGVLMFSLICARTNGWANNGDAGDLRRHRAHYDVIYISTSHQWYNNSNAAHNTAVCILNTLRPRQNSSHFAAYILKCILFNQKVRISIEMPVKFVPKGSHYNNKPSLLQIIAHNRRQIITRTIDGLSYWRIYASLGLNEWMEHTFPNPEMAVIPHAWFFKSQLILCINSGQRDNSLKSVSSLLSQTTAKYR